MITASRILIASVRSQSIPMGSVLSLEAGGSDARFKARPIEGVKSANIMDEPGDTHFRWPAKTNCAFSILNVTRRGLYREL